MENSTGHLPTTVNHSFSGAGNGNASEESGWTSYIDYFMEAQRRQEEKATSAASSTDDVGRRSSSQFSGDCAVGGYSRLPALIEPSEASNRLSLNREAGRRKKKVVFDESLEDTATSPISSPKLRESDANHQKKKDARDEFSHYKKATAAELAACNNNLTKNGANTMGDMIDGNCAYDNNELRKKRLA